MKHLRMGFLGGCIVFSLQAHAVINFGMAGDSLTDEYLASSPGDLSGLNLAAKSWVQILAQTRSADFNFGAYKPDPNNNWGGSRDTGFEYNYAKSGAVASDNTKMLLGTNVNLPPTRFPITSSGSSYLSTEINGDADGIGLAGQVGAGKVDTAFIGIGANDFLFKTNLFDPSGSGASIPIPLANLNLPTIVTQVSSSILNAIDALRNAQPAGTNLNMLVGMVRAQDAAGSDPRALAIADAVNQINTILVNGVASRRALGQNIATVDLWAWATDPNDPHHYNADGSVNIGGLTIEPTAVSKDPLAGDLVPAGTPGASTTLCNAQGMCATQQNATHLYTEPKTHPNTLIQALLANEIIDALNTNFGAGVARLSDSEILAIPQYTSAVPVPAAAWLFASGVLGLLGVGRYRRAA
ncbi:MAG TPA: hypothetical protein VLC91_14765 [Spongiibacteraceae bacterium]|nr:hypothetical protein [Spongiibacteraceae bacterium]